MHTPSFQGVPNYRPYLVVAVMPGHKPKIIGRTSNRMDGDRMVRFLQRKVTMGAFYLVFEPPNRDDQI